jgi:hypothetical protein
MGELRVKKKIYVALALVLVFADNGVTQETQLKQYTTYRTSLTNEDIMGRFVTEVNNYLRWYDRFGGYYFVDYEVSRNPGGQNYAWGMATYENKYQWGTVYTIQLRTSNAYLRVMFCNTLFSCNGQNAKEIVAARAKTVTGNVPENSIVITMPPIDNKGPIVVMIYNNNYSGASMKADLLDIIKILN